MCFSMLLVPINNKLQFFQAIPLPSVINKRIGSICWVNSRILARRIRIGCPISQSTSFRLSLTCNCRRGGGWRAPKSPRRRRPAQRRRKRPRRAASVAGRPDPNDVDRPAGLLYDRSGNLYSAGRPTAVCPIPALSE